MEKFKETQLQVVTRALLLRQAVLDRSTAIIVLYLVLKIAEAVDVSQLQAGIDLLPLNSAALEYIRESSGQSKTVLELVFLSTSLVPPGVQLADALRAVNSQPWVWKSRFPALAPEFDKFVQALNREFKL